VQAQTGGGLDLELVIMDQNLNVTNTVFFGGSNEETLNALSGDKRGAVYVVGRTRSTNLPVVNPIQANLSAVNTYDGFLAVFHPHTLQPVFATYLGGTGLEESLNGVTVDAQGNIYVVGETFGNFPNSTPGAIQPQLSGRTDAFIITPAPSKYPLPLRYRYSGIRPAQGPSEANQL
jgi:Beta-propeller repeat